jgi:transcription initiation factor TFIIIB Brf1 subunit/transcription initiation factor TFIIB
MCNHEHCIDDYANGCIVCTECGLVISKQLFVHAPSLVNEFFMTNDCKPKSQNSCEKNKDYISDICQLFNIDTKINVKESREACEKLQKELCEKNLHFKQEHVASYSIYCIILKNKLPVSYSEFVEKTNIPLTTIRQLQKYTGNFLTIEKPENFIGLFCYTAGLSARDEMSILNIVKDMDYPACRPRNVAIAIIHAYCTSRGKNSSLKKLCNLFSASVARVKKIAESLLKKNYFSLEN